MGLLITSSAAILICFYQCRLIKNGLDNRRSYTTVKSRAIKRSSRVKTVRETTVVHEHRCTSECLRPIRRRTPPNLRRVSLGYIYMSSNGRFYHRWGDGDWLSIEGVDFMQRQDGALVRMFRPTEQLHIHSPGGSTGWKEVTSKEVRPSAPFLAQQAAKEVRKHGANLRDTQRFLASEAAKVVPRAPKTQRPVKGTGRGAPGQPRSSFSKEVVILRERGMREREIVDNMMNWLREHGQTVTPLERRNVKRRVHRWFSSPSKKLAHN